MNRIYFAASIRGGREDTDLYKQIIEFLQSIDHEVLTEHFGDKNLTSKGESLPESDIYKRDIDWVKQSDAVVAEVTQPSLGVGYEIAKAEEWGKKVICLFRTSSGRSLSAMIVGSPQVEIIEYEKLDDLKPQLEQLLT